MRLDDMAHMADQERKRVMTTAKRVVDCPMGYTREIRDFAAVLLAQEAELATQRKLLERCAGATYPTQTYDKLRSDLRAHLDGAPEIVAGYRLKDAKIDELVKENDIMGALLERYQAGIQMSGDSTYWQKHLLKEGEDGRVSKAGHNLSDSCANSGDVDNGGSVITDATHIPTPLKLLRACQRDLRKNEIDSALFYDRNAECIEQWSDAIVAAMNEHGEKLDALTEAVLAVGNTVNTQLYLTASKNGVTEAVDKLREMKGGD